MEDLKNALNEHVDLVSELFQNLSGELRSGFRPAVDSFIGFFHAIDWTEPWLICLMIFHIIFLLTVVISRKNSSLQLSLSVLTFAGVLLAERINNILGKNWKSFSSQNYFDPHGLFISVLWSGPLLCISMILVVNNLFMLCQLIIKWKRAELRHKSRVARNKQE